MNEVYVKLIERQSLSEEAHHAFYEKVEADQTQNKLRPVLRITAIAVSVLLLLIPVTVLAVESIFGVVIVKRVEQATVNNRDGVGLYISFDNIRNHPITDFSKRLRTLNNTQDLGYTSWEEAEQDLGIKLISNSIFANAKKLNVGGSVEFDDLLKEHCLGRYCCEDGQLYYAGICAAYKCDQMKIFVRAELTAKHPGMTEEQLRLYHETQIFYYQEYDPKVTTEQFTTKEGIPMTVCRIMINNTPEYIARFAVNNITYEARLVGYDGFCDETALYADFLEILEAFHI